MEEQHVGALGEVSLAGQIDKAGHGLAGVDGVEQDAFRAGEHFDGLDHGVGGQGVAGAHVVVEGYDFFGGHTGFGTDIFEGFIGEVEDGGLLNGLLAVDADAGDRDARVVADHARDDARVGARAAARDNHVVNGEAAVEELAQNFLGAAHIAESADFVGSAAGHNIGLFAFGTQLFGELFHFAEHVGAAGDHGDGLHAEKLEQEVVARGFGVVAVLHAFFKDEVAVEAFLDGPGEGQAAMVGLHGAAGDDGVRALIDRVGHAEVELTGLVASGGAGKQVIALDVDVDVRAESFGEVGKRFQRRRFGHIAATGKLGEIHNGLLWV